MQQLFRIVLFAVLGFFGHGSAAEAQAQLVQRECRPQVVNTLSFSMSVPIFPELYNASAEEVACCDSDASNAFTAGSIYVRVDPGRRASDPPIICNAGTGTLVATDIAGPAARDGAPSSWPTYRQSMYFMAVDRLAGWDGQTFVGVQRGQIIEYACSETNTRSLRVALFNCPCGVNPAGHCEPRPSGPGVVQPPTGLAPGQIGQGQRPGNVQLVPGSPIDPNR